MADPEIQVEDHEYNGALYKPLSFKLFPAYEKI
jgi:hypothetical protein